MVTLKNGKLTIVIDIDDEPRLSSTGKSLLVATMSGKQAIEVNGKPLTVNVNAFIKV